MRVGIIKCTGCKREFERESWIIKRYQKRKNHFCSLSCQAIFRNKQVWTDEKRQHFRKARKALTNPFKYYLNRIRMRVKKKPRLKSDIDLTYLTELWEKQDGKCAITHIPIILPSNAKTWGKGKKPDNASLDRIDSKLGYIKGNVQFIALSINLAKTDFSQEDFIAFLGKIK